KEGLPLREFTARYKQAFFEDIKLLKIEPAEVYPAATDHIPEMIALIQTLMDKGIAYQSGDGSIYFSIAKFPAYGQLAKIDMTQQRIGERINSDEYAKDSVADFALWKAWDEKDGDVKWDSPWGPGRPGWHIECSAMSQKYLGKTFDIHTGGIDNMFPHHEDEIAQSEAANGCKFVNYWLHCEHLTVNRQKMSKSLGNFYTMRDLLEKGWSGAEIRWVLIGTHYRSKLNFDIASLDQSRSALKKFADLFHRLDSVAEGEGGLAEAQERAAQAKAKFGAAFGEDLNVAEALAELFKFTKDVKSALAKNLYQKKAAAVILDQYRDFDRILAALDVDAALAQKQEQQAEQSDVPADVLALVQKRVEAKKAKDFATADAIRDELKAQGWLIEDSPAGPRVTKA
ncbi:MAG: cysteine--tRNA ligase, partial [Lentisphaeria bacterium]|nr:cysteine--tRNA ligase [Lentisphaeria bacterium]